MASRANIIVGAIIAVVVVAALAVIALPHVMGGMDGASAPRALVHDGDGAVHELPLDQDSTTAITTSLGTNVVVVEAGSVYVREADCDNHDCIRQGSIDAPGRQIICLPHELWIEVVTDGEGVGQMDPDSAASLEDIDVTSR